MVNKKVKIILMSVLLGMGILFIPSKVNAGASISVHPSKTNVTPGETFSVTVTLNGTGKVTCNVTNGSGYVSQWLENSSTTFNCTAGSSGTVKINASGNVTAADLSEEDVDKYGSATVNISAGSSSNNNSNSGSKGTTSNNNNNTNNNNNDSSAAKLTSLTVGGQKVTISNIMSITLENSKTTANVVAKGTGVTSVVCKGIKNNNVNLDSGSNKVSITVTANGQTKTYTLNIIRLAEESNVANIDDSVKPEENQAEGDDTENSNSSLRLNSLNVKDFNLNPEFSPDAFEYSIDINMDENDIDELSVEALATEGIDVKVIGNTELVEGENVITIILKKDEEQTVYQIIVNKIKSSSETEGVAEKVKNKFLSLDTPKKVAAVSGVVAVAGGILTIAIVVGRRKTKEAEMIQEIDDSDDSIDSIVNNDINDDIDIDDISNMNHEQILDQLFASNLENNKGNGNIFNVTTDETKKINTINDKESKEDDDYESYRKLLDNHLNNKENLKDTIEKSETKKLDEKIDINIEKDLGLNIDTKDTVLNNNNIKNIETLNSVNNILKNNTHDDLEVKKAIKKKRCKKGKHSM